MKKRPPYSLHGRAQAAADRRGDRGPRAIAARQARSTPPPGVDLLKNGTTATATLVSDLQRALASAVRAGRAPETVVVRINARWSDSVLTYPGEEVVAGFSEDGFLLNLGGRILSVPAHAGPPMVRDARTMAMLRWGLQRLGPGVWDVAPSIKQVGIFHGYIVLVDVPEPAPWEIPPKVIQ